MGDLVERVVRGDDGAVLEMYRRYSPIVKRYLLSRLPDDNVDEVLQDVFISAIDSISLFKKKSSLKTWLLAIARHEVADFYRKRYIRKAVDVTVGLFDGLRDDVLSPESVYYRNEVKERIVRSMERLSDRYREVLFWRFEVGMSVKDVAERMNLSFKATESLLYRARKAFVVAYENEGE